MDVKACESEVVCESDAVCESGVGDGELDAAKR